MYKKSIRKTSIVICIAILMCNVLSFFTLSYAYEFFDNVATDSELSEEEMDLSSAYEIIDDDIASDSEIDEEEEPDEDYKNDTFEEPTDDVLATDSEITCDEEIDDEDKIDIELDDELFLASDSEIKNEDNDCEDVASPSNLDIDEEIFDIASKSDTMFTNKNVIATQSNAELTNFSLGFVPLDLSVPITKKTFMAGLFTDASIPTQWDSREHTSPNGLAIIPEVRNQGSYGVCWSFSTLGMMETSIRKKDLVTNDTDSDLSEAALAYFYYHLDSIYSNSSNMDKPGYEGQDYTRIVNESSTTSLSASSDDNLHWAQIGGNQLPATLTMSAYMGATKESNAPYTNMSTYVSSGISDKSLAYNSNSFVINNAYYINKNDTNEIKKVIMNNGSAGISYYESKNSNDLRCEDSEYYYCTTSGAGSPNHAVMIVGWDDNIQSSKFPHNPSRNGAWLVRNNWGSGSRNGGYFWLSYGDPNIYDIVFSIDAIKSDTYKYNYHYDTTGSTAVFTTSTSDRIASIYKVYNEDQELEAVSVPIYSANARFDISIYTKDTAMGNPFDGTLKATVTKNATTAGIYTVEFPNPVALKNDTYFSVVVIPKVNNVQFLGDNSITVNDEKTGKPVFRYVNMTRRGQSYLYRNGSWQLFSASETDTEGQSLRIKALTNPADCCTITFDANGGSGTMPQQSIVKGVSTQINENKFTKSGYTFKNWDDHEGHIFANKSMISTTSDVTLYANWNVYVPTPVPPYNPTNKSSGSGGGGGGGGGGMKGGALPTSVPKQSDARVIPNRTQADHIVSYENAVWNYDPVGNKWSLGLDKNNSSVLALNGFYSFPTKDFFGNETFDTYYFDETGTMLIGWIVDAITYDQYYLDANMTNLGKMAVGWKEIGTGNWYHFALNGKLTVNGYTPDGILVGSDGLWRDPNVSVVGNAVRPGV